MHGYANGWESVGVEVSVTRRQLPNNKINMSGFHGCCGLVVTPPPQVAPRRSRRSTERDIFASTNQTKKHGFLMRKRNVSIGVHLTLAEHRSS
jgi:hypothetical protein